MSLVLAIDTTGRGGAVVIADGQGDRACVAHDPSLGYAESLFGLVDAAFAAAGCGIEDIGRVCVVRGPGSFTGLRIGIMTAKGLAFARSIELWSADTLPLLAATATAERVVSVVDAGAGHVFAAAFDGERCVVEAGRCSLETALALQDSERCEGLVAAADDRGGDALAQLESVHVERVQLAPALARCSALGIAPASAQEPSLLVPNYLVPSQAERVHGMDLTAAVHSPIAPEDWG